MPPIFFTNILNNYMEQLFAKRLKVLVATLSSVGLTAEASEVGKILSLAAPRPPKPVETKEVTPDDKEDSEPKTKTPSDNISSESKETDKSGRIGGISDDTLLDYGVGSSSDIKSLQKALLAACFDLPRFGVDGIYKSETRRAVKAFKRQAKKDGKYFGPIDGEVNKKTFDLIKEYADKSNCSEKIVSTEVVSKSDEKIPVITKNIGESKQESGNFTFYIGDSQMGFHLGRALISVGGSGIMKSKVGSRASTWNLRKDEELIPILKKGPSKIIISLNGNGISGTDDFINTLASNINSSTKVVWTGAPPPLRKDKSSYSNLTSDSSFASYYDQRNRWNKTVGDKVRSKGWTFINPYDYIKYDKPQVIGGRTFYSGYTCYRCDGIHLPASVAKQYVSKIQSML